MSKRLPADQSERPPLFRTWNGWYWFVAIVLFVLILFFYLFTKKFS